MKKIGNSFSGIIGGIIFIIIGVVLLWWNEGNNVRNLKTTAELSKTYINVSSDKVDPQNEGKLIATNGKVTNEQELSDSLFNITVKTPLLKRVVEVYQWEENSETDSDGDTTYTYKKVWSDNLIDSSSFNKSGYTNPTTKEYDDEVYASSLVNVGAFELSDEQIRSLSTQATYNSFDEAKVTEMNYTISGSYITNSKDMNNPEIGDTRIQYVYNDSTELSVLAVQKGNSFITFVSQAGKKINRVMDGIKSGEEMINVIKTENKILKWVLRAVGIIAVIAGVAALFKPISTLANFVPILGGLVNMAVGLVALIAGLAISLVVIAIAWIRFRPILGICLLVIVGVLVFILIKKSKSKKVENNPTPQMNTSFTPEIPEVKENNQENNNQNNSTL